MKRTFLTLGIVFSCLVQTFAQNADNPDFIRSIGKIYVVVAVIVAIFLGIVFFLVRLERRISKLEQQSE